MASNSTKYTVQVQVVGDDALRKLQTQMASLNTSSQKISTASRGLQQTGRSFKNMGNQVQNASFQITDFIVQVQGGTSAARAFSQQAPQLLGAFGAMGAAIGIVAAVAPAVIQAFAGMSVEAKDLAKGFEDVASTAADFAKNQVTTASLIEGTADKYGVVTERLVELEGQLVKLKRQSFELDLLDQMIAISDIDFNAPGLDFLQTQVDEIRRTFETTNDSARNLGRLIDDVGKSAGKSYKEQLAAVSALNAEVGRLARGMESPTREVIEYQRSLAIAEQILIQLADGTIQSADAMGQVSAEAGEAAQQAGILGANVASLVAQNAGLATQAGILERQATAMENGATAAQAAAVATRQLALATAFAKANDDGIITADEQSALWDYEDLLTRLATAQGRIAVATKAQSDATRGSAKAMSEAAREAKKLAQEQKRLEEQTKSAAEAIDERFGKAIEDGIINAAKGGKDAFKDMAASILEDIARMYIKAKIVGPLMQALGLGNKFTSAGLGVSARGNYFPQGITGRPMTAFASGGVIGGRSVIGSNLIGEAGPEAVIPLRRHNGRMGVEASPVNISVINNAGAEVSVSESKGNDGSRTIDIMIEQKIRNSFATGGMDKIMQSRFGSRPVGA